VIFVSLCLCGEDAAAGNPQSQIRNPQSAIRNPKSAIQRVLRAFVYSVVVRKNVSPASSRQRSC
ncbi:MAG: hypothetical protein DMG10_17715, partial [Acidobacteria bacterium]